jgi:ABC-type transporter MlaC component
MAVINQTDLAGLIKEALDNVSDQEEQDPEVARQLLANKLAEAVALFVIGRQTIGPTSDGATATTIIQ